VYLDLRHAREKRKFDIHARFARMNIKFSTFHAPGCAAQHTTKTVRADYRQTWKAEKTSTGSGGF
jgi:hypothetical protein